MKLAAYPPVALTERDLAIVEMTFSYGGLGIQHVQKRFFPSPGARAACYTRVARLCRGGYLRAQRLPSATGLGSGREFLTIGPKSRPLLAKRFACSLSSLGRQTRVRAPLHIQHELTIIDFRLALEQAVAESKVFAGVEWTAEWELRRHPERVADASSGGTITLVSDGRFSLTLTKGGEQQFAVEVDMGTMTNLRRLRIRLRGYLLRPKRQQIPVLWVAPSTARADQLVKLAADESKKVKADATVVWVTTQQPIDQRRILSEPIWQVVGGPKALALVGAAAKGPEKSGSRAAAIEAVGG